MTRTFFSTAGTSTPLSTIWSGRPTSGPEWALIRLMHLRDLDKAARDHTAAGYGEFFTHRLGHFIGQTEHEKGDVTSATDLIAIRMVFSIEPGVYLPGESGNRVEWIWC